LQWSHIEQTSKQSIQEKKIRVTFLPADEHSAATPRSNGLGHSEDHSMLSSPSPEAFTPQRDSNEGPLGSVSRSGTDRKSFGDAKESVSSAATPSGLKSAVNAAAAGVANVIPTSSADLQAQLADAKATIAKLREQVETSTGLRQRKTEPTPESKQQLATAERVSQAPAGGVSVQVTAGLCLLSFLLAYFLF
jgi:hypothetical protein